MNEKYMTLVLEVGKAEVFLNLKEDETIVERILVCDGYSLLEKMLPAIDVMLQKHHLERGDIKEFKVISDLPEGYSARRITETIASIYGFANEYTR